MDYQYGIIILTLSSLPHIMRQGMLVFVVLFVISSAVSPPLIRSDNTKI